MKVLFAWHAAVEPEYRKLFQELAQVGMELVAFLPTAWTEGGRLQKPPRRTNDSYRIVLSPVAFRDKVKRFFYLNIIPIIQTIKHFRPDIVHIFEEPYSLACAELVGLTRMFHPSAKVVIQSFENLPPIHRPPFLIIERFVLKGADALLTIPSEGEALWRNRDFRGPIYHIPVGLDENLFRKTDAHLSSLPIINERERPLRIAYAGRLVREKGVSLLLQALYFLVKEGINVELVIVGDGPERNVLKLQRDKLGVTNYVVFIDSLQSHDLPLLYSNVDILVLPSLTTETWKEQFGRVLVEAMACEVAVVGSSSGEIPDIVGDAGIVFPEGDISALSRVLKELVLDPGLREKLGKAGRARVLKHFTWRSVAERLCRIYAEVRN